MNHNGWPPVRIRNYADEVHAVAHLDGPLAQLDGLLSAHSAWHDVQHARLPSAASADFTRALTRLCVMMADMRKELSRTLEYAKAAAGLEAVVGEGDVAALVSDPVTDQEFS